MTVHEADEIVRRDFTRAWASIIGEDQYTLQLKECYKNVEVRTMDDIVRHLKGWR